MRAVEVKKWRRETVFVAIAVIFTLGLVLRIAKLGSVPPGLHIDEASYGYNAYSILKTGADEFGAPYPLYTRSFGTGKNPIYLYASVASVAVFGLTEFAARFPAAIFGSLTVFFTFLLATELTGRRDVGLLSALFLALNPWHLFFSRFGFEVSSLPCFVSLGLYLLLRGLEKPGILPWAGLVLGLSLYTYAPVLPFLTIMLIAFMFLYRSRIFNTGRYLFVAAGVFFILAIPHLSTDIKGSEQSEHFKGSLIFNIQNDQHSKELLEKSPWPAPLFSNSPEPVMHTAVFIRNYLSNYSPGFLFRYGDLSSQRTHVKGYGVFHYLFLPFLVIGIFLLIFRHGPPWKLMLVWFFVFPLGSAIASQTYPSATRVITALPFFQILFAISVLATFDFLRAGLTSNHEEKTSLMRTIPIVFVIAFATLYLLSSVRFTNHYFKEYPRYASLHWNTGFKEAINKAESIKDNYSQVVVSKSIPFSYIYVLFYTKYDPVTLQQHPLNWDGPYRVGNIGKYSVRDPYLQHFRKPQLFITGFWERPDLPEVQPLRESETESFVKVVEFIPENK